MTLEDRLARLQTESGGASAPKASLSGLRERISQLENRGRSQGHRTERSAPARVAPEELARSIEGRLLADGLISIRKRLPLNGQLGSMVLASLRNRPKLPGEQDKDARRHVYIDTETTGLSGGSGTLAFLVGLAVVTDDAIESTQFLITRFAGEAPMLSAFAECLTANDRLVSYNGKSYDLPLLISRFRMQALAHPFTELAHLDLLHPVRRLFGRQWQDCRLITMEERLLGFYRVDDLPGSEAPAAWFTYLRHGRDENLIRVVAHHRQDMVSLAVAHSALTQAIAQPRAFAVDISALARWLAETSEEDARRMLLAHADSICDDGKRLLARLSRRAGDWTQALVIWETLAARGCTDSMERLAKYHEHISKDLAAAQRCCEMLPDSADRERRHERIRSKRHRSSLPFPSEA